MSRGPHKTCPEDGSCTQAFIIVKNMHPKKPACTPNMTVQTKPLAPAPLHTLCHQVPTLPLTTRVSDKLI